jgi:hypothetical protein
MMENKTAMTHLIDKILRMPESNIKGFLNISGPAYIEAEKEQIINARINGDEHHTFNSMMRESYANDYYNETYANDTTTGLPEEDSKRRAWHY